MKVGCQTYRGIEFVRVPDLPSDQQLLLSGSPDFPERIKILMGSKLVEDCIQYKDYEAWFFTVYKRSVTPAESLIHQPVDTLPVRLAFDKA